MLADLICLAWIIIFAYKCYKLEQENKRLKKSITEINGRTDWLFHVMISEIRPKFTWERYLSVMCGYVKEE